MIKGYSAKMTKFAALVSNVEQAITYVYNDINFILNKNSPENAPTCRIVVENLIPRKIEYIYALPDGSIGTHLIEGCEVHFLLHLEATDQTATITPEEVFRTNCLSFVQSGYIPNQFMSIISD